MIQSTLMPLPSHKTSAKSARIVMTTFGSLGDLHPYLAIAGELKRRGHHPVIATSEMYRDRIGSEGSGFFPVRPDLPTPEESGELIERVMHPTRGPEFLFRQLLMPHLRDSYADLSQACIDSDLFLTHPVTFAAPLVARKMKLRWVSSVLSPISLWSLHDPPTPPVPLGHWWPRSNGPANRVLWAMARHVTGRWLQPVMKLRREIDLQSTLDSGHPMFEGQHSPQRVLALFSAAFAQPQPDWPAQTRVCGFCFHDRHFVNSPHRDTNQSTLSRDLETFLQSGSAPIVFTLGSAAVFAARNFFRDSQLAARQLKRRAIYVLGDERNRPPLPLNRDELVMNYAPYSSLFPHAAIVVHQGGIGTTAQTLRAGVPQLIMPFSHDQPDNAARITRLQIGRTLPRSRYNARNAALELQAILTRPKYFESAKQIAQQMNDENGAATACDEIESML